MEKELMVKMVEGACPFARNNRMRVSEVVPGRITMILEDDQANLNAFGLVHAGAICGLVETTGGMAIFSYLNPTEQVVLNSVLNIRFTAMPVGELKCSASVSDAEIQKLQEDFTAGGKADKAMDLKVVDSSGKMVAEAQATFRLMPTPESLKKYFSGMLT